MCFLERSTLVNLIAGVGVKLQVQLGARMPRAYERNRAADRLNIGSIVMNY